MKKNTLRWQAGLLSCLILVGCATGNSNSSRRGDAKGMYKVRSGDTLVLIARANNVSYTDIMRWNNLTNPNQIEVGWRLRVKRPVVQASTTIFPAPNSNKGGATTSNSAQTLDPTRTPDIKNAITWRWPVAGAMLARFDGGNSKGVALAGNMNDPVMAAAAGEIVYAGNGLRGYGNMVVINHNDTWSSVYANNATLLVERGTFVNAGQVIARMGNSDASRVQLYYEVRLNAKPIDPLKVMPAR